MKSRSYKLSTNDDWVEESWTVDCVCGVNFDDGEEMVNCDDCGVWVHTRCSRYVKSEKSFACDKCKNRKTRNDSEETEVAQLLVELPTKTLRMENPTSYGPSRLPSASTLAPAYIRPCRLWTDIPIKERVHMQGIPGVGDDPSVFSGVSSVFGPQLWKCAGYVPKKFNFPYKECPYWEEVEEDVHKKNGAVSQHIADNTVRVRVSSNSEILSDLPEDLEGVETKNGEVEHDKLKTVELATKLDSTVSEVSKPNLVVRKDQLLLQSSHFQCAKRKDNYEIIKDRSGKKKARTMENHGEFKKKNIHFLGPASTNSSDVKKLQRHEERGHAAQKDDPQGNQILKSSDTIPGHQLAVNSVDRHSNDHKNNSGSSKNWLKEQSLEASTNHSTSKEITKEGQSGFPIPEKSEDLSKTILKAASLLEHRDSWGISAEVQVAGNSDANTSKFEGKLPTGVRINSNKSEIVSKDVVINHTKVQAGINKGLQDNCELNVQPSPVSDPNSKTRGIQTQSEEKYADCPINSARVNDTAFTALKSCTKVEDVSRGFKMENRQRDAADDVSPVAHHQPRLDKGGSEDYLDAKNSSKEYECKISDEPLKSNGSMRDPSLANGESEPVASVGNSSSISAVVSPNSSAYGSCIAASANYEDTNVKLKKISESNVCSYKDYGNTSVTEVVKGEGSPERPKILLTKLIRSSHGSITKSTQTKKFFHSSNSKRTFTDSKEPISRSANTLSPVPTLSASAQPADASILQPEIASDVEKKASSLQSETASSLSKKVTGSVLFQKGEKINQPVPQMSSKVNTSLAHVATSSNSPATLSDEELALLLHQELNSSPRVPRVPRMRHAGSLPQLTSPTASGMMKRTSSAGGKDHGLAPRRRDKEFPKDNSHSLRDGDDETEKTEWTPSLSDHGGQDSGWTLRLARDSGNGSAKGVLCMKRTTAAASSATTSSSPVEATEHSLAVNRSRNPSADDNMVVSCSTPRTLPGLIADIMSKGQRMTYEELCNAVLPHWPNLRKHNGERYAYSSHSQAVLDCLRNRNEWARLVDRGPKTCVGRKRRKLDSNLPGNDSEDNDDGRDKTVKTYRSKSIESSHEEFPKGKRKARKWSLKGRVTSRSKRRLEEFSDDEADSYLNSSEDASVSEDEIQGGVTPVDGAEVSKSSNGIESCNKVCLGGA